MKQQLKDYGVEAKEISIKRNNTSAIVITHNHVLHSRTKHIDIKYHFIRYYVEKKDIMFEYVKKDNQLPNILTKPLSDS